MAEALTRLAPSHDVLVSDIGMPSGDGYELLARIRTLPPERGGRVPALALTAYALPEDRRRILAAGFAAHVAKPVDPAALVHAVYDLTLAAARSEAERLGGRRVLVVDDDEDYLEATRALLEAGGFVVDVAASGQEAVQKARRNRPAAALVDSRLPDMSGIEVAEALRTEAGPEKLLIVATSGFSPLDAGERAAVFDAWLTKPLDLARLTALLERPPRA
jgi:CheY-like chemotaxis protein